MQSEQTNISDLMHGNCKLIQGICDFVIPCYQRPYSWTEEQWGVSINCWKMYLGYY